VGFGVDICEQFEPKPDNAIALICGPPPMIRSPSRFSTSWAGTDQMVLSLENRMKCGIGICGRCNVGPEYVCKDGPVFTKDNWTNCPGSTIKFPGFAACNDRLGRGYSLIRNQSH
jgi:sulfhydrogenase subunit gamma (sulfur reductase)